MLKIKCSVNLLKTDKVTNIRLFEGGILDWLGTNISGGENVIIEIKDTNDSIIATSDSDDKYLQIGMDFIWSYIYSKKSIKNVYVTFLEEPLNMENVKLHSNGNIIVSPCDEKEYTEKDVITMLSYAVAHEKITSKEMKEKVDEVLN